MGLFRRQQEPGELADVQSAVVAFEETGLGQSLLEAERALLAGVLPGVFGYRLVQLGISPELALFDSSDAGHRFVVSPALCADGPAEAPGYLCSEANELALAGESADIVLLHHVLDFDPEPHAVLREATRVLISGGTLVVVGFNPLSLFALRRAIQLGRFPWSARFIAPHRLRDWMTLLDLYPQALATAWYRLPVFNTGMLAATQWMERVGARSRLPIGAVYVMTARKHPVGMTPLRPRVRRRGILVPGINPTFGETRVGPDRRNLL